MDSKDKQLYDYAMLRLIDLNIERQGYSQILQRADRSQYINERVIVLEHMIDYYQEVVDNYDREF